MSLAGRVALVTGAGRGVGRGIAIALAEDGADVAINYRRDADAAAEVVAAVEALGRRARAYQASVDDFEQDREMVGQIEADLGPIGILINNAGIASRGQAVADTDPAEMQRVVACHAFAPHYLSKLVIPKMRQLGPRRHRDDLVRRNAQPRCVRRAVQHGQMRDGSAGVHVGQGRAAARHSREHRRARSRRNRNGSPPDESVSRRARICANSTR